MNSFHDTLNALLTQAHHHQLALAELESAIQELEIRLGRMYWLHQEQVRKLRDVIRQHAEFLED